MSNYSNDPADCRVDFWKPSGKWYDTETLRWDDAGWGKEPEPIHTQMRRLLKEQFGCRCHGMRVTCLEPYHEFSHPISVVHE